ncbi:Protein irg-1 [Caenorhabditis elegans]|uniref:Protein irg-1 n=1 Tax=Caenorhabditis elegans TaxID=6239 RepID=IRG1_CAEEL|nr:NADAR domain-containing protein [Caenorhabditis elegans]CCD62487.1 NADAR domain-containing protein [Caenorhabditis elegans]|eukprot:NP_503983.1 Infection Response Gene [Caenorhabditis elegans]
MHTKVYVSEDRTKVFVLFYEAACVFSNFYPSGFEAKPVENFLKDTEKKEKLLKFTCSEQYFMYNKALLVGDMDIAEQILKETNPMKMKLLGRKLSMTKEQLKLWSQKSKDVMYRACLEKFSQNEDCRMILFRTHGMKLVEASPTDKIWGIGLDKADQRCEDERNWRGSNWLGEVLDQVREELWTRQEFKSNREQILKESLETRCQILEHFSH